MQVLYDNKKFEVQEGASIQDVLKNEIKKSEVPIIGAKYNNEYKRLDYKITEDGTVSLVNIASKGGMKIYRRTLIFIMAMAFERIYPEAKLRVNYQLSNSMYCDLDNINETDEMIKNVEAEMKRIVEKNIPITKKVLTREEAEKLYEKKNSSKGRLQLDMQENKSINMYYCEEYYNYIYEDIAINTGITNIFELIRYGKGFLLRYPSSNNPFVLPEYKETKKLLWALDEYNDIHKILGVRTVYMLNRIITEQGKAKYSNIKYLIMLEEALHEKKIAMIADKIAANKKVKMVLIAGPSSSGKTTFAQRLGLQLRINGLKPVTISVDNYFVERKDTPLDENGEYDFENIEAIDLKLFNKDLTSLLNGEVIECPEFDFSVGTKRYKGKTMHLAEDEILVIEGIHCLNDKLTALIPKEQKYKVYISDLTILNMDRLNRISTTDTRLIRRIVRDYQFRSYSAQHTLRTWPKVNRGEEKNIFPYQEDADSIFNTSLIYELAALKDIAMPLLEAIPQTEKEYAEARRLIEILRYFKSIPADIIPNNSLLKEFLGGGYFVY